MIVWRSVRRPGWVRVLVSMGMIVVAAPAFAAADDTAGPPWLRAPLTRGPVAASAGLDAHHAWWGIDAAIPLNLGSPRVLGDLKTSPAFGLGLSVAGQGGSEARGLRWSALVDRRTERKGAWLGLSTGGGGTGLDTRLQLGTGLWRSLASVEMEAGVVSSLVRYEDRQVSHWGFYRDSLHWRDTTTYENVARSGLWHTAQSTLRWRYARMEVSATGGVTIGQHIAPRRWAQAVMNVQASRGVKVMAAYGQRPAASMAFDPTARAETMIGAQFAPWASREGPWRGTAASRPQEWSTRPRGGGRIAICVRCRQASRVELTGDFTDWAPVELTATGSGWWEATLPIQPGLHQVQIRLDAGEWLVPPGLLSTEREFAGEVGTLLIE